MKCYALGTASNQLTTNPQHGKKAFSGIPTQVHRRLPGLTLLPVSHHLVSIHEFIPWVMCLNSISCLRVLGEFYVVYKRKTNNGSFSRGTVPYWGFQEDDLSSKPQSTQVKLCSLGH